MKKERLYLDYNATAPLLPAARAAMIDAMELSGNPSSVHAEGRGARSVLSKSREAVASLCGVPGAQVSFCSGATEAANHVLTPDYRMGRSAIRVSRLLVSAVEHPAVLAGGRFSADQITVLAVDRHGRLDLGALEQALADHDETTGQVMLGLQLANNETGVIQPVREAADLVHAHRGLVVVDAVQGAGRLPLWLGDLGADFLILSGHKFGGPKGTGALVSAGETLMPVPLVRGGGQEKGHRGGTENLIGIAGFGAAAEAAGAALSDMPRLAGLRDQMETAMRASAPDLIVHADAVLRLGNTSFFSLPGLKAETAQIAFDMEGLAVSAGAACSSGKIGLSHVLSAMGADADLGAIRISLGNGHTESDIEQFLGSFNAINSRRMARRSAPAAA
ncbi:cysteine desulfurase family protein [Hoeflea sp. YIM 152468]|uniref:cysteine desulfurase family protein n=1 Tax=Hoeflea sp. YIM 152468 TaxID=3031759 RepID=UPI0023D9D4B7|nr:cysteine desulfurase family protein [Hoeflea sp. YIM 152468]MDF1607518.1 cysteine desulfurase family protein [Hoeflea sp. YIM 152468]